MPALGYWYTIIGYLKYVRAVNSPAWTLFLPLSHQAYKISHITNISPVKSCETYKISHIWMSINKSKKRKARITFFIPFACYFFCKSKLHLCLLLFL